MPDDLTTELECRDCTPTEAAAVAKIARDADPVVRIDQTDDDGGLLTQRVYDRDGRHVDTIDVEEWRDRPRSKHGTVEVHTPGALIAYATRHLDHAHSTLWANVDRGTVTAILNDHEQTVDPLAAGWGDHQANLKLRPSPEWDAWTKLDGEMVGQTRLAEFLEEHVTDVVEPDGATMLEVTQTFHATTGATFKQAQSTHSGEVQLRYEEEINAAAGRAGEAEVPREFVVSLRPFLGTDRVPIRGQFRYRVHQGSLTLGIRLLNLDDVVREAVDQVVDEVADELALTPIHGTAPSPRR